MFYSGHWKRLAAMLLSLVLADCLAAAETIRVGAAHFPPYVIKDDRHDTSGLLPQLLEALNREQPDYRFTILPTAIVRRFGDLQRGRIDMAVFENPDWGWQGIAADVVDMGLEDAELFVARREPQRGQEYFQQLAGKRLALYRGYHYGFADFNSDPEYLGRTFNANLGHSHDSNLLMVLRGRADIALVTRSNLHDFLGRNHDQADRLLISERVDQVYRHHALIRQGAPISAAQFAALLEQLRQKGELARIFDPYKIAVRPAAAGSSAARTGSD